MNLQFVENVKLINQETWQSQLQWNSLYCNESIEEKLPYLTYEIKIRCKNLNLISEN